MIVIAGQANVELAVKQYWEEVEYRDFICREAPHFHLKLVPIGTPDQHTLEMKGRLFPWDSKDLLGKSPKAIDLLKLNSIVESGLDFEADCVKRCCELERENIELRRLLEEAKR